MIALRIDTNPTPADLCNLLAEQIDGAVESGMVTLIEALEKAAREEAPVRTSALRQSITSYLTSGRTGVIEALAPYAGYIHEGTGLYGPHGRPIVMADRTGKKVTRKGQRPNPFFTRAIEGADSASLFEEGLEAYLAGINE